MQIANILEEHPVDLLMDAYPHLNRKTDNAGGEKPVYQNRDNDEQEAIAMLRLKLDYDRLLNEALVKGLQQSTLLIERLCKSLEAQEQRIPGKNERRE